MLLNLVFFSAGLLLLCYGASWLVKGASTLAGDLGIRPMVIGLTVVAFGTSAPELFVSIISSIQGKSMIAVGNAVGSNICNIGLVLGLTALCNPVITNKTVVKYDIPIMIGISFFLLLISLDSQISRLDGFILFSGIIIYTFFNYYFSADKSKKTDKNQKPPVCNAGGKKFITTKYGQFILIILGISGIIAGADILIDAAVKIMQAFDVNEKFIGLTVIAFGTSLPELATSMVSALKKEMDISIGNLIGSNVFNILSVLGAASLTRPISINGGFIESGLIYDYLAMIFVSIFLWCMLVKKPVVSRINGAILLTAYTGYIIYLNLA